MMAFLAVGSRQAHALEDGYRTDEVIVRPVPGVTIGQIIADYPGSQRLDEGLPYNLETRNTYLLKAPPEMTAEAFVDALVRDPQGRVEMAELNYVADAPEDPTAGDGRHRAWGISSYEQSSEANATFATNLNLSTCARDDITGATVAVLDTGAQLGHQELRGNFRRVERYDFVQNDRDPSDSRLGLDVDGDGIKDGLWGHGTHVAGIVDQVAPGANIMPLRVLDPEGYGEVYDIARAISFTQAHGVDAINLSLGTSEFSKLLYEMVKEATGRGTVVVAAAGNSNTSVKHYPAATDSPVASAEDGLLAVTSADKSPISPIKSSFANYGYWVDIAAPGEDIRSAFPRDKYANWSGTSMATPFISGLAALIRAIDGSITPVKEIEDKIRKAARPIDAVKQSNSDPYVLPGMLGAGHANVCGSISGS